MKEEIPKLKEIMKELTRIKDKANSTALKMQIDNIIFDVKDLAEMLDY